MPDDDTTTTTDDTAVEDDRAQELLAQAVTSTDEKDWKAEYERLQAESRKWESRAKANSTAAKELERLKAASMSEQEKAVAEAEQRGRATALAESGQRLVRAEFRAAAAGRLDNKQFDALLDDLNLAKFVREDGEPDTKAITAAVERLAPARAPSFDGGARQTAKTTDMNALIRQQAGYAR
jgi:two-component sensor histidine kinase